MGLVTRTFNFGEADNNGQCGITRGGSRRNQDDVDDDDNPISGVGTSLCAPVVCPIDDEDFVCNSENVCQLQADECPEFELDGVTQKVTVITSPRRDSGGCCDFGFRSDNELDIEKIELQGCSFDICCELCRRLRGTTEGCTCEDGIPRPQSCVITQS